MSSRRGTSPALPRASDCRPLDSAHIRGGRGPPRIQAQLSAERGWVSSCGPSSLAHPLPALSQSFLQGFHAR